MESSEENFGRQRTLAHAPVRLQQARQDGQRVLQDLEALDLFAKIPLRRCESLCAAEEEPEDVGGGLGGVQLAAGEAADGGAERSLGRTLQEEGEAAQRDKRAGLKIRGGRERPDAVGRRPRVQQDLGSLLAP